jgi:hypothetical protein
MASVKALKALAPQIMRVDGTAAFVTDKIVLAAAPAAADTLDFLLPAGSQLCQLEFFLDDSDTGAAFVFSVGYRPVNAASSLAAAPAYFAAAGQTTGQAGGRLECAFKPIRFEEDVYIMLTVGVAPAGIAGNPEIHMIAGINQVGPK